LVVGWTPDSTRIVFLAGRASPTSGLIRAYSVPLDGGLAELLPLDRAGLLSFSPDGKSVAYNRIFRNYELRKRYVGGRAQDIYIYNFDAKRLTQLTDWKGTDTAPMWSGHTIYFLSDRDSNFRANIWAYDLDTKRTHQVTHFSNFDIDFPSLGDTTITFQQGGALYAIDLPSEKLREIPVKVPDDGARTAPRTLVVDKGVRAKDALGGVDTVVIIAIKSLPALVSFYKVSRFEAYHSREIQSTAPITACSFGRAFTIRTCPPEEASSWPPPQQPQFRPLHSVPSFQPQLRPPISSSHRQSPHLPVVVPKPRQSH
jgi:hypothetical protein